MAQCYKMLIKSLAVKNFKRFQDKALKFSPGLNVVYGRNEQGKTTIAEAMLTVLYGDPTSHSQKFKQKYSSWQSSGNIVISAELEIGKKNFLIQKDFTDHKFLLKDKKTGKVFDNYKAVAPKFFAKVGIGSENLYKSTAYFSNKDLTEVHETKSLSEAVKHAIVGMGGVKLKHTLGTLKKALIELNKGLNAPAKTPGVIKHLHGEIAEREAELHKTRAEVDRLKKALTEKKTSGSKIEEIEEKIKNLEAEIKGYDELKAAEKDLKSIEEKSSSLERDIQEVKRIQSELNEKQKEMDGNSYLVRLDLDKLEGRLAAVRLERGKLESDVEVIEEIDLLSPKFGLPEFAIILGGAAIGVLVGILAKLVYGLTVGVLGLGVSIAYYGMRWSGYSVRLKNAQSKASKSQKDLFKKIEELKNVEKAMLKKAGSSSFEEFAASRARFESLRLNIKELKEAAAGYLSSRKLSEMEKEQLGLFTKKKEIESTRLTDQNKASQMNENEFYRKRSDLDMLRLDLRDLTAAKGASDARVQDAEVSVDDVARLEEEIESLRENLQYYERKARVLALAEGGVEKARDDMVGSNKEFIESGVEKALAQVTGGRYKKVRVGPDLKIEVFSTEKDGWIVPDEGLSRGTIDQVYLSFRLALLEVVSEGKPVPLILDDPFLTFDEERLASTREMLEEWAQRHQVFLFTTRDEYKDWGNVVEI